MAATYFKYMVFGKAKDHELHSKRPPFALQKVAFSNASENQRIIEWLRLPFTVTAFYALKT